MTTFGLLLFPGVEELDFVGPWEVFTASSMLRERQGSPADTVATIAQTGDPVGCNKGLRVLPEHTFGAHPPLDVVLVPGGMGTRTEVGNPERDAVGDSRPTGVSRTTSKGAATAPSCATSAGWWTATW